MYKVYIYLHAWTVVSKPLLFTPPFFLAEFYDKSVSFPKQMLKWKKMKKKNVYAHYRVVLKPVLPPFFFGLSFRINQCFLS